MTTTLAIDRRLVLRCGSAAALAAWWPAAGALGMQTEHGAFAAGSADQALDALGGTPTTSTLIALDLPDVADNGAVVPVQVVSHLPGTGEVFIVAGSNPQPLAARFTIPDGTEAFVSARIRLADSGTVTAVVRTDAGLFATTRDIQVVVGGCG